MDGAGVIGDTQNSGELLRASAALRKILRGSVMNERTSDALTIIDSTFGGDAELDRLLAEESLKLRIGQMVYDVREGAGLQQSELAKRLGVDPEVIRRVEVADYDGGAIEILIRVCLALHKRVKIDCSGEEAHPRCRVKLLSA